jgi:hypothetical protein
MSVEEMLSLFVHVGLHKLRYSDKFITSGNPPFRCHEPVPLSGKFTKPAVSDSNAVTCIQEVTVSNLNL